MGSSAEAAASWTHALTRQAHLCATAFRGDREKKGRKSVEKGGPRDQGRKDRSGTLGRGNGRASGQLDWNLGRRKGPPEKWGES